MCNLVGLRLKILPLAHIKVVLPPLTVTASSVWLHSESIFYLYFLLALDQSVRSSSNVEKITRFCCQLEIISFLQIANYNSGEIYHFSEVSFFWEVRK